MDCKDRQSRTKLSLEIIGLKEKENEQNNTKSIYSTKSMPRGNFVPPPVLDLRG